MSELSPSEQWVQQLAARTEPVSMPAPSRLKAKLYSRLVQAQAQSAGLATLTESSNRGFDLCVFEKLVQIAPLGERIERSNPCRVCHARVVAEHMEHAPIYWPHCPYVRFSKPVVNTCADPRPDCVLRLKRSCRFFSNPTAATSTS